MKWSYNIRLSYIALWSNKQRMVFSVLAMAVGIAAVITTLSIGEGARAKALAPILSMGRNLLVVNPAKTKEVFRDGQKTINATTLSPDDVEDLSTAGNLKNVSAFQQINGIVKYGGQSVRLLIQGTSESYTSVRAYEFSAGSMFTADNNKHMDRVAVIGSTTADALFKTESPLNKTIYINNIPFEIIGVLKKKGLESEPGNIDNVVIMPVRTLLRRVANIDYLGQIYLSAESPEQIYTLEKEAADILRSNHNLIERKKEDDFEIINQISSMKAAEETASGFNLLIMGVAAISLIIGGTGILAMMILSVRERTMEIGLRLAVGAKKRNIIGQFLSESLMIGIAGGLAGTIAGILASWLTNSFTSWETTLSPAGILVPFVFSLASGLLFGVFPAYQAASLDPVAALRKE